MKISDLIPMTIVLAAFIVTIVIVKSGLNNSKVAQPPHWERVCLIETKIARVSKGYECACKPGVNLSNGNYDTDCNIERVCNIYEYLCEKRGWQCVVDPNYTGKEKSCQPMKEIKQ